MTDRLLRAALAARDRAHAPYSHFKVGAALQTATGEVFAGCNIENASYGLTLCAERVAIGSAVAAGFTSFNQIVVVSAGGVTPCGACRQVLAEFGDFMVRCVDADGGAGRVFQLRDLLPHGFGAGDVRRDLF